MITDNSNNYGGSYCKDCGEHIEFCRCGKDPASMLNNYGGIKKLDLYQLQEMTDTYAIEKTIEKVNEIIDYLSKEEKCVDCKKRPAICSAHLCMVCLNKRMDAPQPKEEKCDKCGGKLVNVGDDPEDVKTCIECMRSPKPPQQEASGGEYPEYKPVGFLKYNPSGEIKRKRLSPKELVPPEHEEASEWEKEFDERFGHWDVEWEMGCEYLLNNKDGKCNCEHDEIKDFIDSLLTKAKAERDEWWREIVERAYGEGYHDGSYRNDYKSLSNLLNND